MIVAKTIIEAFFMDLIYFLDCFFDQKFITGMKCSKNIQIKEISYLIEKKYFY